MTPYAEKLIGRSSKPPAVFWDGWVNGVQTRLRLVNRNSYGRCLVEWPDGIVREMTWVELNRRFKAVGLE